MGYGRPLLKVRISRFSNKGQGIYGQVSVLAGFFVAFEGDEEEGDGGGGDT